MDFTVLEFLGFGGTGVAMTLGVLALFWKADDAFSEEFRAALSKKLQHFEVDFEDVHWSTAFMKMFDGIFGEKHLTWRCFIRSSIASFLCFIAASSLII